jgi:hypothetical protein
MESLQERIVKLVNENLAKVTREQREHTIFLVTLKTVDIIVKLVFWRPRNYMLVAHSYEAPKEEGGEVFNVTSYHDSCWCYDGFSFFNLFSKEQKEKLEIVSTETLEFQHCFMDNSEKFFVILNN